MGNKKRACKLLEGVMFGFHHSFVTRHGGSVAFLHLAVDLHGIRFVSAAFWYRGKMRKTPVFCAMAAYVNEPWVVKINPQLSAITS